MKWQRTPEGVYEPAFGEFPMDQDRAQKWANLPAMLRDYICGWPLERLNSYGGNLVQMVHDATAEIQENPPPPPRPFRLPRLDETDAYMGLGGLNSFLAAFTQALEEVDRLDQQLAQARAHIEQVETQLKITREQLGHAEVWLSGFIKFYRIYDHLNQGSLDISGLQRFLAHRARKGEGTTWHTPD